MTDYTPTLAGFTDFLRTYAGINTTVLPDGTPVIQMTFDLALATVNRAFICASPIYFQLGVYNLGTDFVINYAPDVTPLTTYLDKLPFFAYMRKQFNINGFVSGVISSASDVSTSQSMVVPDSLSNLTLADLQNLKTPWGRAYLAIAQKYGPNIFGMT